MTRVAMFLSSHKIGLSSLLTEQAIHCSHLKNLEFSFLSGENEQELGLRKKLGKHGIECHIIKGLDHHHNFLRLIKEFRKFGEKMHVDIVHVQTNWQLLIAAFTRVVYRQKFKIVYTIHGYRNNRKYVAYMALLVIQVLLRLFASHIFAASSAVFKKFLFVQDKLSVLPLGVEESFFSFSSPARKKNYRSRMIFPGQFREGKNQDLLIHTVAQYIDRTADKSIQLVLPGDGPLKNDCVVLSKQLGIEKNVIFPGQLERNKVLEFYSDANIAIVPSSSETFGHAIAEPFVLGLCVISRRTGIAEDIIKHGDNGFIFDNDNEIIDILIDLHQNEHLIQKCGDNAFEARDQFRWKNLVKTYEEKMLSVIQKGKA